MTGPTDIDPASPWPKKKQLADIIRARILSGDLGTGQDLPSEKRLAEQYGVGSDTVKEALLILKAEGLVMSERGRPWWVRPVRMVGPDRYARGKANYNPDQESSFATEHGVPWSRFNLGREYRTIPAPARVATALQLEPSAHVCERFWTHAVDGPKIRLAWSYLDMAKFANTILTDIDEPPWPGGTIAQLKSLGYNVTRVVEDVGVSHATEAEAELLGVEPGSPLMEKWRTQYVHGDPHRPGVPVEIARHLYPGLGARLVYEIGVNGTGWIDWIGPASD